MRTKKITEEKGKTNETVDKDGFALPKHFQTELPAGTREYVTFLVRIPRLLQHSCRGMIRQEMLKIAEEEKRRGMTEEEQSQLKKRLPKAVLLPEEIAEEGTYPTEDGRFYHPAAAFLGAALDGCWAVKAGYPHPKIKESMERVMARVVRCVHEQAILLHAKTLKPITPSAKGEKLPYLIDFRTAVNSTTGGRILTWRPLWLNVACFVTFSYDVSQLNPTMIQQALELGGDLVGVGAFRPLPPRHNPNRGRGGPFGTFVPELWKKDIPVEAQGNL